MNVTGKRVIVTGASSGLGLSIARGLADAGARVASFDIDAGGPEPFRNVDVRDREALDAAFAWAADLFGGIDVVFANAGIGAGPGFAGMDGTRPAAGALENISAELWDRVLAVDLTGAFFTLQSAVRVMKRGGGKIIFTTSIASFRNETWVGTPYMPAKAGVAHLMRQAAKELAAHDIRVNAIAPGFFPTNLGKGRTPAPPDVIAARIPLGRLGREADIQGLALFLASDASDYLTGVEIPLDGGMSLG